MCYVYKYIVYEGVWINKMLCLSVRCNIISRSISQIFVHVMEMSNVLYYINLYCM